jgi:hypothetical protein
LNALYAGQIDLRGSLWFSIVLRVNILASSGWYRPFTRLPSGSNSEICSISVYEANRIVLANRFFVAVLQKVLGLLRRRKLCYHVVVR